MQKYLLILSFIVFAATSSAQEEKTPHVPQIHGTIRSKYEYQTEEGEGRFEVRNARVSMNGNLSPTWSYKAEIDLSDEGSIKMLDAYTRLKPWKNFQFTIGQMRVPFTIDAHRSPHMQYFANRSFIAKQVGNVRDVGMTICYTINKSMPIILEAGLFNGSGLTDQKDFWTKNINFSAKAQIFLHETFNLTLSAQKTKPEKVGIMMYDTGAYWHNGGWHAEIEYLHKSYDHHTFKIVHSCNSFISYDIPVKKGLITYFTPLVRYDYMSDHSDGVEYTDEETGTSTLVITDCKRSRLTGGVILSLHKPFISDIRINYEKYFYSKTAIPKTSEKDKIVIEFMTHF